MARVTKQMAEDISEKLVQKLTNRLKEIEKEFGEILYEENLKKIPKEVLEVFAKHPSYFTRTTCGYIYFLGRNIYTNKSKELPKVDSSLRVEDKELCERLTKLENEQIDLIAKKKSMYRELVATIMTLSTTNKIAEYLPEAIPFIPADRLVPAINLTDTRNKLKEIL